MKVKKEKVKEGVDPNSIKIIPDRVIIEKYKNALVMYIKEDLTYVMKEFPLPFYGKYRQSSVKITEDLILEFSKTFARSYKNEEFIKVLPELLQYSKPIAQKQFERVRDSYLAQ
jgi:hypothetical protein